MERQRRDALHERARLRPTLGRRHDVAPLAPVPSIDSHPRRARLVGNDGTERPHPPADCCNVAAQLLERAGDRLECEAAPAAALHVVPYRVATHRTALRVPPTVCSDLHEPHVRGRGEIPWHILLPPNEERNVTRMQGRPSRAGGHVGLRLQLRLQRRLSVLCSVLAAHVRCVGRQFREWPRAFGIIGPGPRPSCCCLRPRTCCCCLRLTPRWRKGSYCRWRTM